jgi:hypothetical protein
VEGSILGEVRATLIQVATGCYLPHLLHDGASVFIVLDVMSYRAWSPRWLLMGMSRDGVGQLLAMGQRLLLLVHNTIVIPIICVCISVAA